MTQDDDPLISILTVNWNGKRYLDDLFNSIFFLNYPMEKLQVLMVDNNSSDDSVEYVKKKFPVVEVIKLDENRGYAGANNEGFKRAKGKYIALINNDCVADPGWLGEMLAIFNKSTDDAKIGAVGPKVVFYWQYLPLQIISESQNLTLKDRGNRKPRRLGVRLSQVKVSPSSTHKEKTVKNGLRI